MRVASKKKYSRFERASDRSATRAETFCRSGRAELPARRAHLRSVHSNPAWASAPNHAVVWRERRDHASSPSSNLPRVRSCCGASALDNRLLQFEQRGTLGKRWDCRSERQQWRFDARGRRPRRSEGRSSSVGRGRAWGGRPSEFRREASERRRRVGRERGQRPRHRWCLERRRRAEHGYWRSRCFVAQCGLRQGRRAQERSRQHRRVGQDARVHPGSA